MYGQPGGNNLQEKITDDWINQNIPGGVNSQVGEMLDNMMGGNPNPTFGQVVGGAPGVGGFPPGPGFPNQYNPYNPYGGGPF